MRRALALIALALLMLAEQRARADVALPASWWVNVGGGSWHADQAANGHNPGLAIEARWSDTWAATAGVIRNSQNRDSRLLAAIYTPWRIDMPLLGPVHTGALAGLTDGYAINNGGPVPMAGLVADRRWDRAAVAVVVFPRLGTASAGAVVAFFRWRFN